MVKNTVLEAIKYFEQCLQKGGVKISKIVLFGSYAKGKATDESDVDIAIVSNDFIGKDVFERAKLTKDPEIMTVKKFVIPLDIVTFTPEEFENGSSLIARYAKGGIVLGSPI